MAQQSVTPFTPERRAGGLLAVSMLDEIRKASFDDLVIKGQFRPKGRAQQDVVGKYLRQITSPEMSEGFSALLTEVLGLYEHCGDPDPRYLEVVATFPPDQIDAEWERRQRLAQS